MENRTEARESPSLEPFSATEVSSIPSIASTLQATTRSRRTHDVQWRLVQLRKLYWGLVDYEALFVEALRRDMRKHPQETILTELDVVRLDCLYHIANLEKWVKDEPVKDMPLAFWPTGFKVRKEPLGTALILGAYNFPVVLSLGPLVGAISAGCTAVVKTSENAASSAMAIKQLVEDWLDKEAFVVVGGGVDVAEKLLAEKWDKIFYTGNQAVGKIVAKKAAETLTPVVLELGGLNPAVVTAKANLEIAARRLMWAHCLGAGQLCVKSNYILVERSVKEQFIAAVEKALGQFFPEGARKSEDFARVINERQFDRMKSMVDRSEGKIVVGGEMRREELFIEPTIVEVRHAGDSMIAEESFGPLAGLLCFDDLGEAIRLMGEVDGTPLTTVCFGSDEENKRVLAEATSGGATFNDGPTHGVIIPAPFGGVGSSGTGSYRGKASFDVFTHGRVYATVPYWLDKFTRVRYMPYSAKDYALYKRTYPKPDFDRTGRRAGWLAWLGGFWKV